MQSYPYPVPYPPSPPLTYPFGYPSPYPPIGVVPSSASFILKRIIITIIVILIVVAIIIGVVFAVKSQNSKAITVNRDKKFKSIAKAKYELPVYKGLVRFERVLLCDQDLNECFAIVKSYSGGQLSNEVVSTENTVNVDKKLPPQSMSLQTDRKEVKNVSTKSTTSTMTTSKGLFEPKSISSYSISNLVLKIEGKYLSNKHSVWLWIKTLTDGNPFVLRNACLLIVDPYTNIEIQRCCFYDSVLTRVDFEADGITLHFVPHNLQWVKSTTKTFHGNFITNVLQTNSISKSYVPLQFQMDSQLLPHLVLNSPFSISRSFDLQSEKQPVQWKATSVIQTSSLYMKLPININKNNSSKEDAFLQSLTRSSQTIISQGLILFTNQTTYSLQLKNIGLVSSDISNQSCELFVESAQIV
jgi:hypothetical protein